jgi:hypothetical protein
MGLRFRRSVKILPGIRLNFSGSGVSTTLGPRGASVTVGPRGTHLNVGLPGTGLSYRTQLSSSSSSSKLGSNALFPSPRALARQQRQEERRTLRHQAEDLHAEREAHLSSLGNLVRTRERDPIDWEQEYAAHGSYPPQPFMPSPSSVSHERITEEVTTINALRPWLATAMAAVAAVVLAPQLWLRIPMALLAAHMIVQAALLYRDRQVEVERVFRERTAHHEEETAAARAAHEVYEQGRAQQHEQEELLRARLRDAVANDDAEIVATVLEVELSNEDLPIPVAYEAEFDGVHHLTIQVDLPPLEDIPVTVSRVTKTCKFSERPMAKRDRAGLYQDVCAGLALRLTHEVYRVLPFMESVDLTGIAEGISLATGHPDRFSALRLSTARAQFSAINLDEVDPSDALLGLGGALATTRDGTLKRLEPGLG